MPFKDELARRQSNAAKIYAHLEANIGRWVSAHELAYVGGFCAWRSRISDARACAERDDREIVWNEKTRESAYMLRPKALARDAAEIVVAPWPDPIHPAPYTEPFTLKP